MTTAEGVFINCPFDDVHRPVHHAIIAAVVACGFEPRSALEAVSPAVPRMHRIVKSLTESRYSVHDLTRAYGEPDRSNLARFNMPFEFGMAFLRAETTGGVGTEHDWLGLVPAAHRHAEFLSDLAGYDLSEYDGTPAGVLPPMLAWLFQRSTAEVPSKLNPSTLADLLPELEALVATQVLRWGQHLPWVRRVAVVRDLVTSRLS
jgi:hypothetical protein